MLIVGAETSVSFSAKDQAYYDRVNTIIECEQLVIKKQDGDYISFSIEVADSPAEMERGLMFREDLHPSEGMLFVFPSERVMPFWMRNTLISLDMLWIDSNGKIVYIHEKAEPLSEKSINPGRPARYVLELEGGSVHSFNIKVGDQVAQRVIQ